MNGDVGLQEASQPTPARRPKTRSTLRQATLVDPQSGQRVKKSFTLRYPGTSSKNNACDRSPLLPRSRLPQNGRRSLSWIRVEEKAQECYTYWTSDKGIGILKCSIAYVLASLATLALPISALLGHGDGKHMVATVVTYFHPARSFGSMLEALILALIAVAYAAVVCFGSMAVVTLTASLEILILGHVIVLIVFLGGSLGFVGWLKQKLGNPLVNVACSLTSLTIITVLTKEEAVLDGNFSLAMVWQVLKIVIMAIIWTMSVNLLIKPTFARNGLRQNFIRITDSLEEILTTTTRSFLSGSEQDLNEASYKQVSNTYKAVFNSLLKDLREAKFEHYLLGTEKEFHIEAKLVKTIERLSQSLSGLRSAAETQFSLLAGPSYGAATPVLLRVDSIGSSPLQSPDFSTINDRINQLGAISEEPEEPSYSHASTPRGPMTLSRLSSYVSTAAGPADIFSLFIRELGPPMKSLAWTLKQILLELPFEPGPKHRITINSNFRRSLLDAIDLYSSARKDALDGLYQTRALAKARSAEVAADFEEVAASCGHFSSCLLDFAEDTIAYLDILEELQHVIERYPRQRSWSWLCFWRNVPKRPAYAGSDSSEEEAVLQEQNPARRMSIAMPTPRVSPTSQPSRPDTSTNKGIYPFLWRFFSFLRKEDIRFAMKVGIGATLWAMFSFFPATRSFYSHWRGEWGLLSYMLVCSMTIGASNTTGLQRFFGTCLGALLAVIAWVAAHENPWALGAFGWIVSLGCFHLIVGRGMGPMGRFILLTYNLSALYAYSLSVKDDDNDDDEGGVSPEIWEIVLHRTVSVLAGCLWGMITTRVIYPISARKKLKHGTALLWLRMGLIWKRDPLTILTDDDARSTYMDIRESLELQRFLAYLEGLRESASHEFELRGPFRNKESKNILDATSRMLGAFHAMNVVIIKDLKASPGEAELLRYTREERTQLSARISHLFSVLASSIKLEYPITDAVPSIEHTRDRFLAKLHDFRKNAPAKDLATDEDFELLYAYALVTGQIANEIESIGTQLEQLYGVLDEENLKFR